MADKTRFRTPDPMASFIRTVLADAKRAQPKLTAAAVARDARLSPTTVSNLWRGKTLRPQGVTIENVMEDALGWRMIWRSPGGVEYRRFGRTLRAGGRKAR